MLTANPQYNPSLSDDRYDLALVGQLESDLLGEIYQRAGREVTYVDAEGRERPYWANRFRQGVQRAMRDNRVIWWVESLVMRDEPTRGFFYLEAAGRLDISLEWLVADPNHRYHVVFSKEAVAAARARLAEHGVTPPALASEGGAPEDATPVETSDGEEPELVLVPGRTFDVRVTVGHDGELSFKLI